MQKILAADSHELRSVTGLRGVAALFVVCYHFTDSWSLLVPGLKNLPLFSTRVGMLGVDLFFVMSGFILSYVYRFESTAFNRGFAGKFIWFRFARIYPVHVAALVALTLFAYVGHINPVRAATSYPLSDLPSQLTLTHVWPFVPHSPIASTWNYPSWSISAEWFAYLFVFPISHVILKYRVPLFVSIPVICTSMMIAAFGWEHFPVDRGSLAALVRVSFEFLAGALVFGIVLRDHTFTRWMQKVADLIVLLMVALIAVCNIDYSIFSKAILLLIPFLLGGLTNEHSVAAKILSSSVMLWLGRVSYSLYMTHAISQKIFNQAVPVGHLAHLGLALRAGTIVGMIVVILGLAAFFYYAIEVPFRNFLRVHRPSWARESVANSLCVA